jgi:hypothetical protein
LKGNSAAIYQSKKKKKKISAEEEKIARHPTAKTLKIQKEKKGEI